MDDFSLFGLSPGATLEEVEKAWRKLVRGNHPDRAANPAEATRLMAEINAAHDRLKSGKPRHEPYRRRDGSFWKKWRDSFRERQKQAAPAAPTEGRTYEKWSPTREFDAEAVAKQRAPRTAKRTNGASPKVERAPRPAQKTSQSTQSARPERRKAQIDQAMTGKSAPQGAQVQHDRRDDPRSREELVIAAAMERASRARWQAAFARPRTPLVDLEI